MTFAQTPSNVGAFETVQTPPLGGGQYNPKPGSQVTVTVAPEPMGFLRLDTGEVVFVPASDIAELHSEFDTWNRLMHEQLLANEVLALADERLELIARAKGTNPRSVDQATEEDARKSQLFAIEWRDQATEAVRQELKRLDKLDGSGKKLIELVPLMEKEGDKPWQTGKIKDHGEWKRDGLDLKRKWGFKSGVGLRDHFKQEERYRGLGPLRVMGSDKLKEKWPKFKDKQTTKWSEVYAKDSTTGKRSIDRKKMRSYLGEQVQALKLKSKDFVKLEISNTGTLGPEALANWNANAHTSGEGSAKIGGVHVADVDFSAEAAAMRYYSGGSLSAEIAPLQGNLSFKAEGSAEVSLAEGRMEGHLYLPGKAGIMLFFLDAEQVSELAHGRSIDTGKYDLGAVRLLVGATLMGSIGVSLCGEVSIGVEMKDVDTTDVNGKPVRGRIPSIKGSRKKARRKMAADVTGQADGWKQTAGAAAQVNFFAGARGGLELKGSLQWRNPHSEKKAFEDFASIAPVVEGMAGLAGELKFACEYVNGVFRLTAHAGLCFGIGAEGSVSLGVGVKQLGSFMYWMYYTLLHAEFKTLEFIYKEAFQAFRNLSYLLVCHGQEVEKLFETQIEDLRLIVDEWGATFRKAEACLNLGSRIVSNPSLRERIRISPPESKGMLIYQLTRHSAANWALDGHGLLDDYLPTQRQAIISILEQTQIKSDLKNVIQHIGPEGAKGDFHANLAALNRFFAAEGPHGLDVPGTRTTYEKQFDEILRKRGTNANEFARELALNGDFQGWYDSAFSSLREAPIRGYPAIENTSLAYALQGPEGRDHPLFASNERGFYSDQA